MSGRNVTPKQSPTPKPKVLNAVGSSSTSKVTPKLGSKSHSKGSATPSDSTPVQRVTPRIHGHPTTSSTNSNSGSVQKTAQKDSFSQSRFVNSTLRKPQFKKNLPTISTNDPQLEIDLVYGEYLQAILKKEIVTNIIKKHKQTMKDQLAIRNDLLYKRKQSHELMEKEVTLMDSIQELNFILNNLQETVEEFKMLNVNYGLETMIENTLKVLDSACDGLHLKCVKGIETQEEYAEVMKVISTCMVSAEKLVQSSEDMEADVNKLSNFVNKLRDLMMTLEKIQRDNIALERSSMYNVLKSASDMFSRD